MAATRKFPSPDPDHRPGQGGDPVALLRQALASRGVRAGTRVCLAFSGGLDSSALLAALVEVRPEFGFALSAAHVDHGLHDASTRWAAQCVDRGAAVGVPVQVLTVHLPAVPDTGIEAAARLARYGALGTVECDLLLLAHHRDDQAESVLLALLRGAGPAGVAAMATGALPPGHPLQRPMLRPWLTLDRPSLERWARARGLVWIEDPSNHDRRLDRNFLRHAVGPVLADRFPGWQSALARSARWAAEAQALLAELAELDLARIADRAPVAGERGWPGAPEAPAGRPTGHRAIADPAWLPGSVDAWRSLPEPRIRNLLRHLLAARGVPVPPGPRLGEWVRQLDASQDRAPELLWGAWALRRWGGRLWLERRVDCPRGEVLSPALRALLPVAEVPDSASWAKWSGVHAVRLALPDGSSLEFLRPGPVRPAHASAVSEPAPSRPAVSEPLAAAHDPGGPGLAMRGLLRLDCGPLRLAPCSGGSRLHLHPGGPGREVRKLFQEAGVPPWRRPRMPGLYAGERLVGVAGLALAADVRVPEDSPGWRVLWHDAGILPINGGHGQHEPAVV